MEFKFGHLYPSLSYLRCGHFYFPTYIFSADMWFIFCISFFFLTKCIYIFSVSHLFSTHRPLHFYITQMPGLGLGLRAWSGDEPSLVKDSGWAQAKLRPRPGLVICNERLRFRAQPPSCQVRNVRPTKDRVKGK